VIIKNYEQDGLLLNISFVEDATAPGFTAFRGRLALVRGEIADASGNRKPPGVVMEHVVLMSRDDKLLFAAGSLDRLEQLEHFVGMYKSDFSPQMQAIIYVVDLTEPLQVELEGIGFALVPMQEGITWNELLDVAGLDKRELKKLSSADKVYAVWDELRGFSAKGSKVSMAEALTRTDAARKRVERGAL
jgi:hypothetical protein